MPYVQHEGIQVDGEDRVAGPFTMANAIGAGAGLIGAWQITGWLGLTGPLFSPIWLVQALVIVAAGGVGGAITVRWQGLSAIDRLTLRMRFASRRAMGATTVRPTAVAHAGGRAMPAAVRRGGRVVAEAVRPAPEEAGDA